MNNPSRIFRFKLNQTENLPGSPILMPPGSSVLSVGIMPSGPCAFALVPAPSLEDLGERSESPRHRNLVTVKTELSRP